MRNIEEGPVRLRAHQRPQEFALVGVESCGQLQEQPIATFEERIQRHGLSGHTHERSLVRKPDVLRCGKEYFVDRAIVARKVHDERASDLWRDTTMCEELHDVKKIARVLAIHGGNQLAA